MMVMGEMSLTRWEIVTVGGQQHAHSDLVGVERHLAVKLGRERLRLELDVGR